MLNKCEFIGRLTKDVDLRHTQGGTAVGNFTVACGEKWKDKNTGEQKELTEFVRCVAWGKVGELASTYIGKGSLIYICGKMQTRKYEQDGITKYATEINVKDLTFLDPKGQSAPDNQQQNRPQQQPAPQAEQHGQAYVNQRQPAQQPPPPGGLDDETDIPF